MGGLKVGFVFFRIFSRFSMDLSIKVTNISSMTWMIRMPGGFPPLPLDVQGSVGGDLQRSTARSSGGRRPICVFFLLCGLLESISYLY